jgi:hypothetical protein
VTIGKPLTEQRTYLRVLNYGPPGTGKTTAGASLSQLGPLIVIDAEGGAKKRALEQHGVVAKNILLWPPDGPEALTYDAVEAMYVELRTELLDDPNAYAGVMIDSMTELSRRLLETVTKAALEKAARLGKQRDRFQINLEDYGTSSSMMRSVLRRFTDLPLHVVLTALERRDQDDDGSVAYGPAMGPSIANDTMGLVDVVCYNTVEPIGDETFYLGTTTPINKRKAKDRFGLLPGRMVDPSALRMVAYIDGNLERSEDPRQQAARDAAMAAAGEAAAVVAEKVEGGGVVEPEAAETEASAEG